MKNIYERICSPELKTERPSRKEKIAFMLASFLDRSRTYTESEIYSYISVSVRPEIPQDPKFAVDHLRRAMIELGFLSRATNGSAYWVAESFRNFEELEVERINQLQKIIEGSVGKVNCPFCGKTFSKNVLVTHYLKKHTLQNSIDELVRDYS